MNDFSKLGRSPLLHLDFKVLNMFVCEYGCFSYATSKGDVGSLIDLTNVMVRILWEDEKLDASDPNVLKHFELRDMTFL